MEQNTQQCPNDVTMSKDSLTDLGGQVSENIIGSQIFDSGVEIQNTITLSKTTPADATETKGNSPLGASGQNGSSEDPEVTGGAFEPSDLPSGLKLPVLTFCTCMAIFALALDTTIIATAIPTITREFKSLNDIGWYGAASFLTTCAFQLLWGRFYTFFNLKWAYIGAIIIFETGNIVSGAAPNSIALVLGRAVAGIGSAVIGAGVFFFFHPPNANAALQALPTSVRLAKLDGVGTTIFVASMVCLITALQWGGTIYPWESPRIIALLILFGLTLTAWVSYQYYKNVNATVPRRLISQRSIAFGSLTSFLMGGAMFSVVFYISVYFQAVRGTSATTSGIYSLPIILGLTFGMLIAGQLNNHVNRFPPFMLFSAVTASIGAGLTTTLTPNTPLSHWCGYLALFGIGQGIGWQQPLLLAQVFLQDADVPTGTALMSGSKVLGGAILISVSACVFHASLERSLLELLPDINPNIIIRAGAAKLRDVVGEIAGDDSARATELLGLVEESYNRACRRVFIGALVVSSLAVIASAGVEWKEIRPVEKKDVENGHGISLPKLWRGTTKSRDG
ncbi:hypothetical protein V501_08382 [Pseudogymnoascus sp. VKM F-4519 (FW-2642)]|nr:hypothetical protein V501_08382 [Pseudogymnoascus sp. VKM F-4519 (FW-2642)]